MNVLSVADEPASADDEPSAGNEAPVSSWYALGVLTLVTLLAFVDRGVLILQAEVIKQNLALSDLQVGLMQGTGVAIFAALASYPLGWLADRFDRRAVLAGCIALWSLAVVASGLAQTYEQLLFASALVGAGEAGLVPIVYALIPELFGDTKRQLANSIYALASQATGAIALALCGALIGWVEVLRPLLPVALQGLDGWRIAFLLAALPAPLMMAALLTVRLKRRSAALAAPRQTVEQPAPQGVTFGDYLGRHRQTFACFYGGIGLAIFGFNCVGSWLAVIYQRIYGQTPQQVGAALGLLAALGTGLGFVLSVWGVRWLRARIGARLNIRVLWLSCLGAIVTFSMMVFARSAQQMYAIQGLYILLLTTAVMVYPTALQTLAPGALRARVVAVMSVVGAAVGAAAPPVVGLVSDQFEGLSNGIIVAAVTVAVPSLVIAMALLMRCERLYLRTAEDARRLDGETA